MAAEFRPLLRSPGSGSRCVLIAEAEPPLDRLGRPCPVAPIGTSPYGGVGYAGIRSRNGSGCDQFTLCFDRFFLFPAEREDV